jgi:carbon-monoxide dehydrogenase medium subunit
MTKLQEFAHPRSVDEALALLAAGRDDARPLAGGTSLSLTKDLRARVLVDLSRAGLDRIAADGDGLHLGAMATLTAVADARVVRDAGLEGLAEAAAAAGSTLLRNQITVGGNLVGLYPWSDLPPVLIALGAKARLRGPGGARELTVEELTARHPSRVLQAGELLVEVVVPTLGASAGCAFLKFARTAFDYSLCNTAAFVRLDGGVIRAAGVAVSALRALPARLAAAEAALVGKKPDEALFAAAAAAGAAEAEVGADFRASPEYRREVCGVLVRRALAAAAQRAAGRKP